jgi:hypothetical protein
VPVFDDQARGVHPEDYELLHHGHLHLYRQAWARDRLLHDLTNLGYVVVHINAAPLSEAAQVRDAIADTVAGWPDTWRGSWPGFSDGLMDCLLDANRQLVVLVLEGFDRIRRDDGFAAHHLLDALASTARWHLLFGRRLICLIHTDDPDLDLGDLGGENPRWSRHEFLIAHRTGQRIPPWINTEPGPTHSA